MPAFRDLPGTPLAHWLGLISTIAGLTILGATLAPGPLADAYRARWPLLLVIGILLVALVLSVIRGSRAIRVIEGQSQIHAELAEIVSSARTLLICVGSRSRDHDYLRDIEERVRSQESLRHVRVFCGDPRHSILKQHAEKLMTMRATDPTVAGRIRMAICPANEELEPALCVSEDRAFVVVPALGAYGRYDSAITLRRRADVETVRAYAEAMFTSGRELTCLDDVNALQVSQ